MDNDMHARTVIKGLVLLGLIVFWIYRWINRETAEVRQALQRHKNPYAQLPPPVDPAIYWYLESRKYETNLESDFSNTDAHEIVNTDTIKNGSEYPHAFVKDNMNFAFKYEIGATNESTDNGNEYSIIFIAPTYNIKYASSNMGVVVNQAHLMIYPYFQQIKYHKSLKLFCCTTYLDVPNYINKDIETIFNRYYFDLKGRYLGTDQGTDGQAPHIGFAKL